jgi:hypothetical protein
MIDPWLSLTPHYARDACCDRGYGRPSGRPRVSKLATYGKVRLSSEPLRLPGGTTISTISLRRLVHNAGYGIVEAVREGLP